ncbi:MAG: CoA transferase, partial [Deltaproteobacteria bacterium]|nr:CoA transferase [Deltaproteobacteria bacterium]
LSGLMSITGTEAGEPVRVGTSITDIVTWLYTTIGILAALYRRAQVNVGARLDVAMLDATVSTLENAVVRAQQSGKPPGPLGTRHPSITPFESFATRDEPIIISAGNDKLFAALCRVLGAPELSEDERFVGNLQRTQNHRALRDIITRVLKTDTRAHWLRKMSEANIPCAPVNSVQDLFNSPQIEARNMLVPVDGEADFKVAGNPVKFIGEPDTLQKEKSPDLGEHNALILTDILGYSSEDVDRLYEQGVIS